MMKRQMMAAATAAAAMVMATAALAANGSVVNVGLNKTVTDVSPYGTPGGEEILAELYQPLFVTEFSDMELIPVIGKSVEINEDGSSATIELFDYVHDSEGNDITADDVIYSYETLKAANTRADSSAIDSLEKIDDYTVVLNLTESNANTLIKLMTHTFIVDEAAYESNPETPAGTGPYKISEYISGSSFTCEKVEDYWQSEDLNAFDQQANVDTIVYQCIPEKAQMTTALENGELQFAIDVDGREAMRFEEGGEDADGFAVDTKAGAFTQILIFNDTEEHMTHNADLRKAILYALNKEAMVAMILNGAGLPAKDTASNTLIGYNPEWDTEDYYSYNPEATAEALKASGYNGETLKMISYTECAGLLELMQAQLAAEGIEVEIQTFENALFEQMKIAGTENSDWDICVDGLGNETVTGAWRVNFNSSNFATGKPQNGSDDTKIQELLDAAMASQDATDIEAFHDYIVDNAYAVGIYATASKCVTVNTISDICYNLMGKIIVGASNYDSYAG